MKVSNSWTTVWEEGNHKLTIESGGVATLKVAQSDGVKTLTFDRTNYESVAKMFIAATIELRKRGKDVVPQAGETVEDKELAAYELPDILNQ